jgi:hypothetical protein
MFLELASRSTDARDTPTLLDWGLTIIGAIMESFP